MSEEVEKPTENETIAVGEAGIDKDRIHVKNLPKFCGHKQFKKLLEKLLPNFSTRKVRQLRDDAYISFASPEEAEKAIAILDNYQLKGCALQATFAQTEVRKFGPPCSDTDGKEPLVPKSAREKVSPLADLPYKEQLDVKYSESVRLTKAILNGCRNANIPGHHKFDHTTILQQVKPSPVVTEYRNKCEFTIGRTLDGEVCVGFVGGSYSQNQHYVIPIDGVDNVTRQMKRIVDDFTVFIKDSGLDPFDEFARVGTYKMLTIRELSGDVMMIVTIFPLDDKEQQENLKKSLAERYVNMATLAEKAFRVTSLYFVALANSSDELQFEHVAGTPYIYESILDCRFRVSPGAFFQTNSKAAAVLYSTIGDECALELMAQDATSSNEEVVEIEGVEAKKSKLDEIEIKASTSAKKLVLLDICCGTGTIGQCILKKVNSENIFCVGIEMIASAVEDAQRNARDNGIDESRCRYVAGKAEDVFRSLRYYVPSSFDLRTSEVVGVLDPPRAGMHEKVIRSCREIEAMKKLIYVSCDPGAAVKNIVDLCRPQSKKFEGTPFRIERIQPVDMFPQTKHIEFVITLSR